MKRAAGLHPEKHVERAREVFRLACPEEGAEERRAREIEALPVVEWKGNRLRTIRCCGKSGKGPHTVNVPESLLWSLLDLRDYFCPYHIGDRATPR